MTGTFAWAPAATAQAKVPTTSAYAASTETPESDTGSVAIVKKDPAGDILLLDAIGQEAGTGKTDAQGKPTFTDLAPASTG